jgi:hypothetical protein
MFYFRINRLKIFDNREHRPIVGLFGPDIAQIQIISFVTTNNTDLPNLEGFLRENNPATKETILQGIVSQVIASRILTPISYVKDNYIMTFGDAGYVLYQENGIPDDFNWTFIAIDQRGGVRQAGQMTSDVVNDAGFSGFTQDLGTLLSAAAGIANPTYTAAVAVAKFATQVIANNLRNTRDREIGVLYMSLNRTEHYLHGERKADDVQDLTNNMRIDYSIFAFDQAASAKNS